MGLNPLIKVSKSRKQILKFSFEPKNNVFLFLPQPLKVVESRKYKYFIMINSIKLVFLCFYLLFRPLFGFFEAWAEIQKYVRSNENFKI